MHVQSDFDLPFLFYSAVSPTDPILDVHGGNCRVKKEKLNGLLLFCLLWECVSASRLPQSLEYRAADGWDLSAASIKITNGHKAQLRWAGGRAERGSSGRQARDCFGASAFPFLHETGDAVPVHVSFPCTKMLSEGVNTQSGNPDV